MNKGTFKKNDQRINREGRRPGSKNKTNEAIREQILDFISGHINDLSECYNQLEPKEKLLFFDKLLRHILPPPMHDLEKLTDQQLDLLIQKLRKGEI